MTFKKGQSGNPKGRPRKAALAELERALAVVGKKKDTTFLKHIAERAFENDAVAMAVIKKMIPDLKQTEIEAVLDVHQTTKHKVPPAIVELIERVNERRSP